MNIMISKKDYHKVKFETDNIIVYYKFKNYLSNRKYTFGEESNELNTIFTVYLNDAELKETEEAFIDLHKKFHKQMLYILNIQEVLSKNFSKAEIKRTKNCSIECKLFIPLLNSEKWAGIIFTEKFIPTKKDIIDKLNKLKERDWNKVLRNLNTVVYSGKLTDFDLNYLYSYTIDHLTKCEQEINELSDLWRKKND